MRISHSVEIRSTPDKVFYWLAEPERALEWMTSVTNGEIIEKTPDMVGTRFRETVEENGAGTELIGTITELTQDAVVLFKGFTRLLMILLGSVFKKKILGQASAEFAKLKELCERD